MLILFILLACVWFICVNAVLIDAQTEYEECKRKFELYVKSDNSNLKFFPVKGNGTCSNKDFFN